MIKKDFWHKSKVVVLGGGSWGTVLAHIASQNCEEVRIWVREEDRARSINSTRANSEYVPELNLTEKVHAFSNPERVFEGRIDGVIWALPSEVSREQAKRLAPVFHGDEIVLHATKGVEAGSLKRVSEILIEELPVRRVGVISGPNLAQEIARGEPAATVVASVFDEVVAAGRSLLQTPHFKVHPSSDVIGVEWGGVLKNIFAIAAGALDAMGLGLNSRSLLMTHGLLEMARFGKAMGASESTFMGLAGVGDMIATCGSPLSRNFRVGQRLARGELLSEIMLDVGSTAEGVKTTEYVDEFTQSRGISTPIIHAVATLLRSELRDRAEVSKIILQAMTKTS